MSRFEIHVESKIIMAGILNKHAKTYGEIAPNGEILVFTYDPETAHALAAAAIGQVQGKQKREANK